ncbi:hypothetical protein EPI10_007206 [Gossypium australe]|uniref:Uncharacterized protein n=1 Tax=Gossypium australe TaxID=47621 RepID=A0A5B6WUU9_9ROSI|nr:hypothetical protein EPI10_007206 [Gossypium australe]
MPSSSGKKITGTPSRFCPHVIAFLLSWFCLFKLQETPLSSLWSRERQNLEGAPVITTICSNKYHRVGDKGNYNTMNYQVIVLGLIKQEKPENSVDFRIKTNQRSNICKNQVERKVLQSIEMRGGQKWLFENSYLTYSADVQQTYSITKQVMQLNFNGY